MSSFKFIVVDAYFSTLFQTIGSSVLFCHNSQKGHIFFVLICCLECIENLSDLVYN